LGTHQLGDPLPVEPVGPLEPELPVDPVDPVEPVGPEEPVVPVEPVEPVLPVEPVQPLAVGCFLQYVAEWVVLVAVLAFLAVLAIAAPVNPVAATIPTAATRPATRCRRLSLELRLRGDMEMLLVVLGDWSVPSPTSAAGSETRCGRQGGPAFLTVHLHLVDRLQPRRHESWVER